MPHEMCGRRAFVQGWRGTNKACLFAALISVHNGYIGARKCTIPILESTFFATLLQWLHFGACRSYSGFVDQHRSLLGHAVSQTFNMNMRNVALPVAFCNSHIHCGICYDSCGSPFRFYSPCPQCRRRLMQLSEWICRRDKTQCGSWCHIKDYVGPTVCLALSHTI